MKKLLLIFLLIAAWSVQAREVYPLCDDWLFSFRYENSSDNARCVTLPHTWNLDALAGTIPYLRTTADYQRKLYVPQTWTGKRLFLKFYGVESVAHLFVNGTYVGEHRGGTTAFVFEITDRVKYGSENLLRVAVSNAITGDVLPLSSIHNIYGGISREVELIVTDPTAISPLYLGSSGVLIHPRAVSTERVEAEAEIHLTSKGDNFCRVTLEAFDPDGIQAAAKTIKAKLDGKPVVIPFTVENPRLWDLDHPNLYRMRVSVESDTSRDEIEIATGFRSIRVTPEEGFRLNDSLVRIHGVTLYYDRPGTGSAMTTEDYIEDFAFVRELGANALRSPAGPHASCLYDLCDRTGVLVWIDLPLIRAPFLSDVSLLSEPAARGKRSPATARNHRPAYQPAVGGHLGTLRLPLATGRKPRALCADTERAGKKNGPQPSDGGYQQPGRRTEPDHRPDRMGAEHRLGQRPHGRPRNLARPASVGVEPAPFGHLLR